MDSGNGDRRELHSYIFRVGHGADSGRGLQCLHIRLLIILWRIPNFGGIKMNIYPYNTLI